MRGQLSAHSIYTKHVDTRGLAVLGDTTISGTSFTGKRNASYDGGNTNNYPWHRIATATGGTGLWQDRDALIEIKGNYDTNYYGLIKVSLRTNGSGSAASANARWLIRSGFASTDLVIARWGVSGTNNVYVDVYLKSPSSYPRMKLFLLEESYTFTLISSVERSDTTTSDKKGSVECYKDVATAATELRGQAYTATANGTDIAGTGRIANYLTNPTSGTTYYPFFDSIGDGAGVLRAARSNDGLAYYTLQGTTSAAGASTLVVGNGTSTGTAGNKTGQLKVFSQKNGCIRLQSTLTSTSDNTATFPAETGTVQMKPTNLYNNTSGSTGTITLSQSVANFTFIDIFYRKSTGNYTGSVRIDPTKDMSAISCMYAYKIDAVTLQIGTPTIKISGTSLTHVANGGLNIWNDGQDCFNVNELAIIRVDGYK